MKSAATISPPAGPVLAAVLLLAAVLPATGLDVQGWGVRIGFSLADIHGDGLQDQTCRLGAAAGGFVTVGLGGSFALQPEVLFVMKGSNYAGDPFGRYEETIALDYVEVPVLARFTAPLGGGLAAHLVAGPAAAWRTRAAVRIVSDDGVRAEPLDRVRRGDLGLTAGAGLTLPVRANAIVLDVRYTLGLVSIAAEGDDAVRNGAVLVLIGYAF